MRIRRIVGASALGIVVAVGLSGCLKMDMQLDLQSDNTVDGTLVFAISSAVADMIGESPESIAEGLQQDTFDFEQGSTRSEPYDDGEFVGTTTYFEGQPLSDFDDPESVRIVREGDDFVVSGAFDMSEGAEGGEMMPGSTDDVDMKISISFPGKVSSHNGTLAGNTVTWQIPFDERLELQARGSAIEGGGGFPIPLPLLIGIGVALLLIVGLILFFVLRRKGAPAAAPAPGYPPSDGYPAQPAYAAPPAAPGPPTAPPVEEAAPPVEEAAPPAEPGPPPPPEKE